MDGECADGGSDHRFRQPGFEPVVRNLTGGDPCGYERSDPNEDLSIAGHGRKRSRARHGFADEPEVVNGFGGDRPRTVVRAPKAMSALKHGLNLAKD